MVARALRRPERPRPPVVRTDPNRPSDAEILANPSDRYPRWRLRVFDLCWPWRASQGEAVRDALASGNATHDRHDRATYFDAVATLQRDPPPYLDQLRWRMARGEL